MDTKRPQRIALIDLLRGLALLAMAVYHFAWDLGFFAIADLKVTEHPLWIAFARATAGSFLALAGAGLVLGHGDAIRPRSFLRRLAMIVAAAGAITLMSWYADPDSTIWFGILHCIAGSSVLGLAFLHVPVPLVIATALACLAAPAFLTSPAFNAPVWLWLGLASEPLPSDDYNPLLPWFGMVLLGIAAARLAPRIAVKETWPRWQPRDAVTRALCLAGRHSLIVYLVHQPLLLGLLWLTSQALA